MCKLLEGRESMTVKRMDRPKAGEGRRAWDEPCEGVRTFPGTPTSHMKV